MLVREGNAVRLVERISEHYRTNISNRFIRPALLQLALEKQSWDAIETLTEKIDQYRYQGFELHELYRQIIATSRFIYVARRELVPTIRNRLAAAGSGSDRVLRDMAVSNFGSNLELLADMINELYVELVELDRSNSKGRSPYYKTMPELKDIGRLLVGEGSF